MAQAKKCDRCKAFYAPYNNKTGEYNGVVKIRINEFGSKDGEAIRHDLCPDCMQKFYDFIKGD